MHHKRPLTWFALAAFALAPVAQAADHREAPALLNDPQNDLTDVYAFRSPDDPDKVIIIANLYPHAPTDAAFPKRGLQIHLDLDGDGIEDRTFSFKFSRLKKNGTQKIKGDFDGSPDSSMNKRLFKGKTTAPGTADRIISGKEGMRAFAGLRNDPFFADMRFLEGPATCNPPGNDSFAGHNVLALVLELSSRLFGPSADGLPPFGVWASTKKDNLGAPLTNLILIPPNKLIRTGDRALKNLYNDCDPGRDCESLFIPEVRDTFAVFNDATTADTLARNTFPDTLLIDPNEPDRYPNGRTIEDDIVDDFLAILTDSTETTDCVAPPPPIPDFPYIGLE
jgi:hypothetical protein